MLLFTKKNILVLTTAFIVAFNINTFSLAEKQPKENNSRFRVVFVPPKDTKPQTTAGAASRGLGKCPQDTDLSKPYLTALLPSTQVGFTRESHPTIFVYIPVTTAEKAFFSIKDNQSNDIYQTILPLSGKGGIVGLKLNKDTPALENGQPYLWSLVLMCNNQLRPDSPIVQGEITKLEANDQDNLATDSNELLKRVTDNAQAGIWYDTVSGIAQVQTSNPNDESLVQIWSDFLNSVGLDMIANQPLLEIKDID